MTDNRMGDDDDDGGVGSQQPGDAALLPHYIPYRLRKILRSRASLIGRQKKHQRRMIGSGSGKTKKSRTCLTVHRMWKDVRCSWLKILEFQDGPANRIVNRDLPRPVPRAVPISPADVTSEVLTGVHVNEEEEATWNTPAD